MELGKYGLMNCRNNLRRLGFDDDDLAGEGSARLIDSLALHGEPSAVAEALRAHLEAGADHVQIQLVTENSAPHPAMPEVLLQVYDDDAFETYGIVAAGHERGTDFGGHVARHEPSSQFRGRGLVTKREKSHLLWRLTPEVLCRRLPRQEPMCVRR